MPSALYRRHDPAGRARYQELKQLARSQRRILAGTPGTLKQRTQSGNQYWVREHIRVDGRKSDEYAGPAAATPEATIERLRAEIELARALAAGSAALRLMGYQRIDRKPAAVLEVLFNRGLFQAGLALVGSHAYGALLNELGISAPGYRTQDIDLARARPLSIALADASSLESLLEETGLGFVPVPGMPSRKPSASFKLPGAETLAVDLLIPGHIPLLDFLIEDALTAAVLSPNQVIPVSVPSPERFALHKLFSSQSRGSRDRDKAGKDLGQAAVLAAAIEEETPGALVAAFRAMPRAGKGAVKRASRAASRLLDAHAEARETLLKIAAR